MDSKTQILAQKTGKISQNNPKYMIKNTLKDKAKLIEENVTGFKNSLQPFDGYKIDLSKMRSDSGNTDQ